MLTREMDENKFTRADITICKLYSPVIRPLIIHFACISKRFSFSCIQFVCCLHVFCGLLCTTRFYSVSFLSLHVSRTLSNFATCLYYLWICKWTLLNMVICQWNQLHGSRCTPLSTVCAPTKPDNFIRFKC